MLTRDQVEQLIPLATQYRTIVNVDGWVGVYSALRLLIDHDAAQRDLLRQREEAVEQLTRDVVNREKEVDVMMAQRNLAEAQLAAMTAERDAYRRCLAAHEQQLANLRGTMNDLRQQRAAMHGPGAPTARWHALMAELDKRFPDPQPYASSDPAEARYLEAIDGLLAQLAASEQTAYKRAWKIDTLKDQLAKLEEELKVLATCGCVDGNGVPFAYCQGCKGTGDRRSTTTERPPA